MASSEISPRQVLDAVGHAVIVSARDATIVEWNRGAEVLYGWAASEVIGRHLFEVTASQESEAVNAVIMEAVRGGRVWAGDYTARRKDGSTVLVHATCNAIHDAGGGIVGIVSVSHDVTGPRGREASLRHDAERYATAVESARMGVWTWDLATGAVEWDEHMEARYGLEPRSFSGTFEDFAARLHPDDRARVLESIAAAREHATTIAFEHRVVWPDDSVHWLEARGQPVFDGDGELVGMVGVGIDIDERKQLEALILEASELRAAARLASDLQEAERIARLGSWRWEEDSGLVTVSAQMARMFGCPRSMRLTEFTDVLRRLIHPDDREELERSATDALTRGQRRYTIESRFLLNGEVRHMLNRGEITAGERGIAEARGTFQDVTAQRRAEAALIATRERLAHQRHAVEVLQDTLIRPSFPELPGFEVAARYVAAEDVPAIGGDWYDAFVLPDGALMVGVGDVSGHGVDASRMMAKLRHATRAYACMDTDLPALVDRLDFFLALFGEEAQIATTLLARLDPATGVFTCVSAGHPPALLVESTGSRFVDVVPGPPLGAFREHAVGAPVRSVLEPGSALLLYTDGLVERRGESIEDGLERLRAGVPTEPVGAEKLCRAALDACIDVVQDDVCVLALVRAPS